jgi:hypothetical protein
VRVILLRDDTTDTGYDLALVTTDLTSSPAELITRYAMRWSIEVTFAEARHLLGTGQAHNRTRAAVERTVPFGLYSYTITVAWYALHGHQPGDVAEHRQRAAWYTTKTDPSLSDMVAQAPPGDHPRPMYAHPPRSAHRSRTPHRPAGTGRRQYQRRRVSTQTCQNVESRVATRPGGLKRA